MRVLLHTCCGPCASACIPRLKDEGHEVALYFSNCNIDTADEFTKRLAAAQILANHDGVELYADTYDHARWLREVAAGFENEPEKGARCDRCFEFSLTRALAFAREHGFDAVATSLTVSPHKPSQRIFSAGERACALGAGDVLLLHADFKKREGFKLSVQRAAVLNLYRQSYCGCEFSRLQRERKVVNHG